MIRVGEPTIGEREIEAVTQCLRDGRVSMGARVERFEEEFARTVGSRYAVMCSSGTAALHLALVALGVEHGDEVLVPDLTYIATANAVRYTGAWPVLVDVQRSTWCIDPAEAESKVTSRTVGILPVHLYGAPADMSALKSLADRRGLFIVEDAAEALGGCYGQKALGTLGNIGVFSFYANKVMTTGEGGMAVTDDLQTYRRLKLYRGQGQDPDTRYFHPVVGFNYRPTEMQGALGLAQLSNLWSTLIVRRNIIEAYKHRLAGVLEVQDVIDYAPWLFTGVLPAGVDRKAIMRYLEDRGIETRPAFVPIHDQPSHPQSVLSGSFTESLRVGYRGLSLPTHPGMAEKTHDISSAVLAALEAANAL